MNPVNGAEQPQVSEDGNSAKDAQIERERLFGILRKLVKWENINNETVLVEARAEIWKSWRETCALNKSHPEAATLFNQEKLPAFHDPFAGGGALPLEPSFRTPLVIIAHFIRVERCHPPKIPAHPARNDGQRSRGLWPRLPTIRGETPRLLWRSTAGAAKASPARPTPAQKDEKDSDIEFMGAIIAWMLLGLLSSYLKQRIGLPFP